MYRADKILLEQTGTFEVSQAAEFDLQVYEGAASSTKGVAPVSSGLVVRVFRVPAIADSERSRDTEVGHST